MTPHRAAAAAVGAPYFSLPRAARNILRANGVTIADPFYARELIRKTATEIAGRENAAILAARIEPILVTMLRRGIDPSALIASGIPNARELGEFAAAYKQKLREYGMIESAGSVAEAANLATTPEPIAVWGHFRPRPEEIALIDRIAAEGSIFWLPIGDDTIFNENRRHAERLIASGWTVDDSGEIDEQHFGTLAGNIFLSGGKLDAKCWAYSDRRTEIRATLGEIKSRVAAGSPLSQFAIVCPNIPDYAELVSAIAAEYQLPVRLPHNLPIAETAVGSFVRFLLDVFRSDFGFSETANFAKHPFGPGLTSSQWLTARATGAGDRDGWETVLGDDSAFLNDLRFDEKQPLSMWTTLIRSALGRFEVRRKAAFSPRECLAVTETYRVLGLANKYDDMREMSADQAAAIITELMNDASVPFQPGIGGVTVYDPDTVIGASFDTVFVIGLSEGHFPAKASDDAVIDFYSRRKLAELGIEFGSAADIARSASLSFFATLLTGGHEIVLSMPQSVEYNETVTSPYVERLGIVAEHTHVNGVSSIDEYRHHILRETEISGDEIATKARRSHEVETRRELADHYDEWDGIVGTGVDPSDRTWSASQLTKLGQCSFRWFGEYILRLSEPNEVELGIDVSLRGTFYHRVLELAVGRAMSAENIRTATLANLEAAFVETENDPETALPSGSNWELQREEHLRILRNAINAPNFISDDSTVLGVEQDFRTEWNGIKVRGSIDRVDLTADGMAAIDYKTSSTKPNGAKDDKGGLSFDIQIPLYSTVGLANLYPDKPLGSSLYYSLTNGKFLGSKTSTTESQLAEKVDQLMQQLRDGAFPVDPDSSQNACKYCELDTACRRGLRLDRKKDVNEEVQP